MIKEHRKHQELYKDCAICYEGREIVTKEFDDLRDCWVLCVVKPTYVYSLFHYKSASYKCKLFTEEFFNKYVGLTFSDDVLVSTFLKNSGVKIIVMPYEPENYLFDTRDSWNENKRVESFPILRNSKRDSNTGCCHPELLKIQPRFYMPEEYLKLTSIPHELI